MLSLYLHFKSSDENQTTSATPAIAQIDRAITHFGVRFISVVARSPLFKSANATAHGIDVV